jgi:MoaA/NifB/PqqE/SkfB family radical SAM enzyme
VTLSLLRGQPRDLKLHLPQVSKLKELFTYKMSKFKGKQPWHSSWIEEKIFDIQLKIIMAQKQLISCEAGRLMAVVYSNGDVAQCELRYPIGNLKKQDFRTIWQSPKAKEERQKIQQKQCWCTHECVLWPSMCSHPIEVISNWLGDLEK